MSDDKRPFMHLQISPFRFPHKGVERRQGLTTVATDLALTNAIHGHRVALIVANHARLMHNWKVLLERSLPFGSLIEYVSGERLFYQMAGGGYIQVIERGGDSVAGARFTAIVDDRDDGVDFSLVAEDCPFHPKHFGLR